MLVDMSLSCQYEQSPFMHTCRHFSNPEAASFLSALILQKSSCKAH